MEENIAIIDLGSNSVRVIVVKINFNASYKMMDQIKEMVRLSEGMWKSNLLTEKAMERTISELKKFKAIIERHNVKKVIALATAAVRNALNGQEFLERVYCETGINFSAITGEEEAYLDYLGVINTIDIENCIIIDTGGGSTELVLVEEKKVKNSISIPFGAVTLTEQFLEMDDSKIDEAEKYMRDLYKSISWLSKSKVLNIVGLGGSVRTLSKVHKRKIEFAGHPIHNYRMSVKDAEDIFCLIENTERFSRKDIPGVNKDRADIILGGLVPIKVLMEYTGAQNVIISGNGLREGAFYRYYFSKYELNENFADDVLQHSTDNISLKYDVNIQHGHMIKHLSLNLFDQLKEIHKLEDSTRKLLGIGALLHDVGLYVDYYDHHCHGFYLALNSRINGLTYRELVICAFIIGMHRNDELKTDWKDYCPVIDSGDFETIRKLSIFVRVCEELCKSQNGNIKEIKCSTEKNNIKITPVSHDAKALQLPKTLQCEKAFRKIFGRNLIIS